MVGIEFLFAGLMFTDPHARPAAATILGLFCLILGVELAGGADSWMLERGVPTLPSCDIGGGLLLGLLLTWRRAGHICMNKAARCQGAAGFVAAGVVVVPMDRCGRWSSQRTAVALEENGDDNNEGTDLIPAIA